MQSASPKTAGPCPEAWALSYAAEPPDDFFEHGDPYKDRFRCVVQQHGDCQGEAKDADVVALLAEPASGLSSASGLLVTCSGWGASGSAWQCYGGHGVFAKLATSISDGGAAALLLRFDIDGYPGEHVSPTAPKQDQHNGWRARVARLTRHLLAVTNWIRGQLKQIECPIALVGWSFGGPVVIEAGAAMTKLSWPLCGVATIASMPPPVLIEGTRSGSPAAIATSGAQLLLIHNVDKNSTGDNSRGLARRAGSQAALCFFHGEDHSVKSAIIELGPWLPVILRIREHGIQSSQSAAPGSCWSVFRKAWGARRCRNFRNRLGAGWCAGVGGFMPGRTW